MVILRRTVRTVDVPFNHLFRSVEKRTRVVYVGTLGTLFLQTSGYAFSESTLGTLFVPGGNLGTWRYLFSSGYLKSSSDH